MTTTQRILKYIAMGFAIILATTIIASITQVAFSIMNAFSDGDKQVNTSLSDYDLSEYETSIDTIKLHLGVGDVELKQGSKFLVSTNISDDFYEFEGSSLTIDFSENFFFNLFSFNDDIKVIIYIPENMDIDSLSIELGVGNVDFSDVTADNVRLDNGIGDISFDNVVLTDTNIDLGIGDVKINGDFNKKTRINNGIGDVKVVPTAAIETYDFDLETGIGDCKINGKSYNSSYDNDQLEDSFNIDSGIGDIKMY